MTVVDCVASSRPKSQEERPLYAIPPPRTRNMSLLSPAQFSTTKISLILPSSPSNSNLPCGDAPDFQPSWVSDLRYSVRHDPQEKDVIGCPTHTERRSDQNAHTSSSTTTNSEISEKSREDFFNLSFLARKMRTAPDTEYSPKFKENAKSPSSHTSRVLARLRSPQKLTCSFVTKSVTAPAETQDSLGKESDISPRNNRDETGQADATYSAMNKETFDVRLWSVPTSPLAKVSPHSFLKGKQDEVVRTCCYESASYQIEIPRCKDLVAVGLLNEFVENYRRFDQHLDLQNWVDRSLMILQQERVKEHLPIAQLLLQCGGDVVIRGFVSVGTDCDNRIEAVIVESDRNFTVNLRGTTEQQTKPASGSATKCTYVPFNLNDEEPKVYDIFLDAFQKIETPCFDVLDRLTDEHPFSDVVFTGYSFGGALSILAAARYAHTRPMIRVSCYPLGSPKVGSPEFGKIVNSCPNLRVMRVEYGQDGKCQFPGPQAGSHVGHTLVLSPLIPGKNCEKILNKKKNTAVSLYKFDAPMLKMFRRIYPDLPSYVAALEEIHQRRLRWVKDYVGISGAGVVVGNETRQVV